MLRLITKPIGCLFSLLWSLLVLGLLLIALVWGGIAWVGPKWLANHIEKRTGFPTTVDAVRVGIWKAGLEIEDVRIMNPSGYPDAVFLHIREARLSSPWSQIGKEQEVWELLSVSLDQISYVAIPRQGGNLERFLNQWEKGGWPWWFPWKPDGRWSGYRNLSVNLRSVVYEDHEQQPPLMRKLRVNYSRELEAGPDTDAAWIAVWQDWKAAGLDFVADPLIKAASTEQASRPAFPFTLTLPAQEN